MSQIVIGVDIAKKKFDVASLSEGKYKHKTFTNNEQGFANSELSRAKTDKADAKLIARYAFTMHPQLWTPQMPTLLSLSPLS